MIRRKLRSQSGVSILMVLLVFLLCATIGSVLLTAATASVGRVAERSKMDQRYYNVVSAAKLFASQIDGQTVTVHQTRVLKQVISDGSITYQSTTYPDDALWITDVVWTDPAAPPSGGFAVKNDKPDKKYDSVDPSVAGGHPHTMLMDLVMDLYGKRIADVAADRENAWKYGWSAVAGSRAIADLPKYDIKMTIQNGSGEKIGEVYGKVTMNGTRLEALFANKTEDGSVPDQWTTDPPADVFIVRVSARVEAENWSPPVDPPPEKTGSDPDDGDTYVTTWHGYTKIRWTDVQIREGR